MLFFYYLSRRLVKSPNLRHYNYTPKCFDVQVIGGRDFIWRGEFDLGEGATWCIAPSLNIGEASISLNNKKYTLNCLH